MLSLEHFLSLFETNKPETFSFFIQNAKVKVINKKYSLIEYMKTKNISKNEIKILFFNIVHKNEYLTRFYETSLKPADITINEIPMPMNKINNNSLVKYKNVIRNIFYLDILKKTKSGIENIPTYMDVLQDLYVHYIIDYKLLTPSGLFYVKEGRIGSVFSSYYFRASIMNPYMVYSLNKSFFHGKKIFTPTLGWGSYFYGFAESGIDLYVGVDVIPSVCKKVERFSKQYPNIETHIVCSPSEKICENKIFMDKYKGCFDVVFFSPPYFKLELYEGGKQSTHCYPTYEEWLSNYWEKTIRLCKKMLTKNGLLCYIISDYGSKNVKEEYHLIRDMNSITERFFTLKKKQPMLNKNVNMTKHKETAEYIFIYS